MTAEQRRLVRRPRFMGLSKRGEWALTAVFLVIITSRALTMAPAMRGLVLFGAAFVIVLP